MAWKNPRFQTFAKCREVQAKTGLRSALEVDVKGSLESQGCLFLYEPVNIPYDSPGLYKPDFVLTQQAIIVEAKGEFKTEDRRKMLLVKAQYPDLDIRFVFSRSSSRIGTRSKTTYAMWCERHGFPYADKLVPAEWLTHNPTQKAQEVLAKLLGSKAT